MKIDFRTVIFRNLYRTTLDELDIIIGEILHGNNQRIYIIMQLVDSPAKNVFTFLN